jgi:hypothetical protein
MGLEGSASQPGGHPYWDAPESRVLNPDDVGMLRDWAEHCYGQSSTRRLHKFLGHSALPALRITLPPQLFPEMRERLFLHLSRANTPQSAGVFLLVEHALWARAHGWRTGQRRGPGDVQEVGELKQYSFQLPKQRSHQQPVYTARYRTAGWTYLGGGVREWCDPCVQLNDAPPPQRALFNNARLDCEAMTNFRVEECTAAIRLASQAGRRT